MCVRVRQTVRDRVQVCILVSTVRGTEINENVLSFWCVCCVYLLNVEI